MRCEKYRPGKSTGIVFSAVLLTGIFAFSASAGDPALLPGPHVLKSTPSNDQNSTFGRDDRGIGLLDKGQLTNMITNYGIISHFHVGIPALHWPRNGDYVQQYGWGVNLIVLADGDLVHSIHDPSSVAQNYRWEAKDGSLGGLFNSTRTEENTAGDGITPILASSDRQATWALIDGEPEWHGMYREDLTQPGNYVTGEFTSDRDIYCEYVDTRDIGLRVAQTAYSYSRPYAEDILFVRFIIHNEGDADLSEVYAGFQADIKPDFYADDRIGAWEIVPYDTSPSFFYKWDMNGVPQRDDSSEFEQWVGPLGVIGMGIVVSPDDAGVTAFHYYHDDYSPMDDEVFAGLMTNDPSGIEDASKYFHGADSTFDDVSLWADVDRDDLPGTEITFTIATGPFSLTRGDSAELAVVFVIGEDTLDLRENVETAYFMAKEKAYQGSGPPETPHLNAVAGDGEVRLYWDNAAESSVDALTGWEDFEGYRLYKSTDRGETWGEPVANWWGEPVGYVPLFQCDIIDSITGLDPAYSADFPSAHAWLGDDTGLRHSYTDTDVTNGIEVWYSITSYDRGIFNPDSTEPSYESGRGVTPYESNTAAVVPGSRAANFEDFNPYVDFYEVNGLEADGDISVEVVSEFDLTGNTYRITFYDSTYYVFEDEDSVEVIEPFLSLYNVDRATDQFVNSLTGDLFNFRNFPLAGDDLPIVDGFRIIAKNIEETGLDTMFWSAVNGEQCTFDWWTNDRHPDTDQTHEEVIEGLDDWRITIIADSHKVASFAAGFGGEPLDSVYLPLKVERAVYEQGGVWEDVTDHLWLSDLYHVFPDTTLMGPFGWDLVPGGRGYNPLVFPNSTDTYWPDMLVLRDDENDTTGSTVWLKTQNGPADAIPPFVGDVFLIETMKPFSSALTYEFTTHPPESSNEDDLSNIKVVPNPFIVTSGLERTQYESRVMFTHLPSRCDITIYTVDGRKVRSFEHHSLQAEGCAYWDLLNSEGQNVAYGVYIYIVKTPDGRKTTGKLMVIR